MTTQITEPTDTLLTDVTPTEAIDAAIKIFHEKAEALDIAERIVMLDICPPAARKDVWRRRRYLAYIDRLQEIKEDYGNEHLPRQLG